MMSSLTLGKSTSTVEITNVSIHGIWLLARDKEYFLPFEIFPWFKDQPVSAIFKVKEISPGHFYWPLLDVNLTEEIIEHPERFTLVFKDTKNKINKTKYYRDGIDSSKSLVYG